jgi:hypothetical protein
MVKTFDFIIFAASLLLFSIVLFELFRSKQKNKAATMLVAQMIIDQKILENKIIELDKVVHSQEKEHFLKFLNESRDAAFQYIELVQKTILDFIESVSPGIEYFNEYGAAFPTPYDKQLNNMSIELEKLKKLLPEENK